MLSKPLKDITEKDLELLRNNSVTESRILEYKLELPRDNLEAKKEFLSDVSSFANEEGGDLLYGIAESKGDNGKASQIEICGVDFSIGRDALILKYENQLRDGIEPRLPNVQIELVELSNRKFVVIFRIQKSFLSPHRVIFNNHGHFYARSSNGKYQLNTEQLRLAFKARHSICSQANTFKSERVLALSNDKTPIRMKHGAKLLLHLIPIESLLIRKHYDLNLFLKDSTLPLLFSPFCVVREFNQNGIVCFDTAETEASSFTQFYTTGEVEAGYDLPNPIPSVAYEKEIISFIEKILIIYRNFLIGSPIFLFLSFVNIRGYKFAVSENLKMFSRNVPKLSSADLIPDGKLELPEILIENFSEKPEHILRPIFNKVWNSFGWPESYNYNKKGNWERHT